MRNKKIKIIFSMILIVLLMFACSGTVTAARNTAPASNTNTSGTRWQPDWNALDSGSAENTNTKIYSVMGAVINVVSIVGAGIALIMLIWLGIKYVNTYEPAQKADIKQQIPTYILGACIIFAASGILKIIQMFIDSNVNNI